MGTACEYKRDRQGNLVFDETKISLRQLIDIAEIEFPSVSHEEIYFPPPCYLNEYHDLLLGVIVPHEFQALSDGHFQNSMPGLITLAQVKRQVAKLPFPPDYSKIRMLWDKQGFHLAVSGS